MTLAALPQPRVTAEDGSSRSDAVRLLQIFAVAVMVFPSDTVFKPIGAAGYPASLIGVFIFAVFCVSILFGLHEAGRHAHPIRGVLAVIWIALLGSYITMDRGELLGIQLASADRSLIRFAVVTGIALVAAEWLRSLDDAMRVVRVLCWGAACCAFVAVLQYWTGIDLAHALRQLPGFTVNQDNPAIIARGSLNRVAGTATSSIELGVVMGMLIPVAICLGLYDRAKRPFKRWAPLVMITLGVATSVSRSAVLSVVVSFVVLVVMLPPRQRLAVICGLPIALGGIFMAAHGLIGVLASFFAGAKNDPSVQYRTHDYPVAEHLWQAAPWFGHGPGTYMPADPLNIFDNQWLNSAVELGSVGVVALVVFLFVPGIVAIYARRWSVDPELRILLAALAAAAFVGPLCSLTFDSFSFPMFVNVYSLVIGLVGACWRLALVEHVRVTGRSPLDQLSPMRIHLARPTGFRPRRADS
jgi:O-antigen ligase